MTGVKKLKSRGNVFTPFTGCAQIYHQRWYVHKKSDYVDYFDEIYPGPVFITEKILLFHEPVHGLPWCLNIHGHDHNCVEDYRKDCRHINLAANVCNYTPVNLGRLIRDGVLSGIDSIHRTTINRATDLKKSRKIEAEHFLKTLREAEEQAEAESYYSDGTRKSFEDRYIPSSDVRRLVKENHYKFVLRDQATIIWNSDDTLYNKHMELEKLSECTEDKVLATQINERIEYDRRAIEQFCNNRKNYVYVVSLSDDEADYEIGHFGDINLAWKTGRNKKVCFRIKKYQIQYEDTKLIKARVITSPCIEPEAMKQIEECDLEGCPVSELQFDSIGRLLSYWSNELPEEDEIKVNTLNKNRFENSYISIPNPFEKGDISDLLGEMLIDAYR